MAKKKKSEFINCTIKQLPPEEQLMAAAVACRENPTNAPRMDDLLSLTGFALMQMEPPSPERLAVITSRWWKAGGVDLTVGFMTSTTAAFRERLLSHFNAAGEFANIKARWSQTSPQIRIAFASDGYWSFLGTDVLSIPKNQPTMNLAGFTANTSESEYRRVARHEWLHTCGCPHEHARRSIIALLDTAGVIRWGREELGWDEQTVRQQILTPLEESSIMGTPEADVDSLMTYGFPGKTRSGVKVTKSGQPILGGMDFSPADRVFLAKIYPLDITPPPPPPPPPPGVDEPTTMIILGKSGNETARYKLTRITV